MVVVSVTEGDDKPLKYPHMFRAARLVAEQDRPAAYVDFGLGFGGGNGDGAVVVGEGALMWT